MRGTVGSVRDGVGGPGLRPRSSGCPERLDGPYELPDALGGGAEMALDLPVEQVWSHRRRKAIEGLLAALKQVHGECTRLGRAQVLHFSPSRDEVRSIKQGTA